MSEPLVVTVPGERMGLIRMGRATAMVLSNAVAAVLGDYVLVDETANHIQVPVVIHRISYTVFSGLTTDDALACGHAYLHELEAALRKENPHLEPESPVTIFQWTLAREAA